MSSEEVTVTVRVGTGYSGITPTSEFDMDREAWEAMSVKEQESLCLDEVFELIDWGYQVKDKEHIADNPKT